MTAARAAFGLVTGLAVAACSGPGPTGAPPASPDERRALADARAMIPTSELPPVSATTPPSQVSKP